jgi:hypothetical protein
VLTVEFREPPKTFLGEIINTNVGVFTLIALDHILRYGLAIWIGLCVMDKDVTLISLVWLSSALLVADTFTIGTVDYKFHGPTALVGLIAATVSVYFGRIRVS